MTRATRLARTSVLTLLLIGVLSPVPTFAAVLFDNSKADKAWDITLPSSIPLPGDTNGHYVNFFKGFQSLGNPSPIVGPENAWVTTATTTTARIKKAGNYTCDSMLVGTSGFAIFGPSYNINNTEYYPTDSTPATSVGSDYCDYHFAGLGIPTGTPLTVAFLGTFSPHAIAGSDSNGGTSFDGFYGNPIPGGFAFQLCDIDGCSGGFSTTTTPTTTPSGPSSVMFLPGIEASRLYKPDYNGGTDRLWEPSSDADAQDMALEQTGKSVRDDIYTRDVIDTSYAPSGPNIYSSFITSMNTLKSSPAGIADWEAIPYDWRLSLDDILTNGRDINGRIYYAGPLGATSTPYIIQELRRLAATSKSGKVTIIAHSNGGLVAKKLTQVLGTTTASQLIDKIIFVDVPQLGTPMAIAALLHGTDQGIPTTLSEKAARHFAQNAPMTYNLLPSSQYFTQTDDSVITFDPAKLPDWKNKYGDVHSTEREQNFILDTTRTQPAVDDLKTPEIGNPTLYSASNATHTSLDAWTPPSGVKLYLVNGWGMETLSSIAYTKVPACTGRSLFGLCTTTYSDSLTIKPTHVVDGDGTVVEPSAMWANGNIDAQRYWVNLKKFNDENACLFKYCKDHKSILEVQDLRSLVETIISGNTPSSFGYITTTSPTASASGTRLHFTLHSPLSLGFTDSSGNYSGALGTTTIFNTPDVSYERYGDVQWLSLPKSIAGKVVLRGEASGTFSLGVEEQIGNAIVSTTSFEGIPSATSTTATFTLTGNTSPTSVGTLQVDYDGNGTTDYSLSSKLDSVVTPPTKPLTVTPDSKVVTLGASLPSLTYTLSGFVDGDTPSSSTSGSASCTTTATPTSPAD